MEEILEQLRASLGDDEVIDGADIEERYLRDWSSAPAQRPMALVRPRSTAEVSTILATCNAAGVGVVAQGGMTGIAGAAIADDSQIAMSLERLRGIEEVDEAAATITAWAGTPIQLLQEAARDKGYLFALDWGARGTATVGGGLATNAGGNRVIRYGMAREHVLGVEAVLADGTVLSMLNKMQKNNAAYDLKQLFIGTEGTLGVITRAVFRLHPLPATACTAICALPDYRAAVSFLRFAQRRLMGAVGAFELMWPDYYEIAHESASMRPPLPDGYPLYVLTDMIAADPEVDGARFQQMLEEAMETGLVLDAAVSRSESETEAFWKLRDEVAEILRTFAPCATFDVSMPIGDIGTAVGVLRERVTRRWPGRAAMFFGHIGDSNLHFIFALPDNTHETELSVEQEVYEVVRDYRGSISAEHGIGTVKKPFLGFSRTPEEIATMKTLKRALDPRGILNPGKVF